MESRPKLNKKISLKDFQDFYWLKKELSEFCKAAGISTSGSKIELNQRISHFLKTGIKTTALPKTSKPSTSKFDWSNEKLSLKTVITDNYKNTENVRTFFKKEIGNQFKFNVHFMNWMKANTGKTLQDAIAQYAIIKTAKKSNTIPKEIAPQFEYNRYIRDFLKDNPKLNRKVGIELWNIKKKIRGNNIYTKEDLNFLKHK